MNKNKSLLAINIFVMGIAILIIMAGNDIKLNKLNSELDQKDIQIELLTSELKEFEDFEEGITIQSLREQNSILFLEMNIEKDKNDLLNQKLEFAIKRLENMDIEE